jgi:hypothetical protein
VEKSCHRKNITFGAWLILSWRLPIFLGLRNNQNWQSFDSSFFPKILKLVGI